MYTPDLGEELNHALVTTLEGYIAKFPRTREMLTSNWKEENPEEWNFTDQADSVLDILALDVAFYLKRRINGVCQSHGDRLRDIRRKLIDEYENIYGVSYEDPNKNVDY